MVFYKRKIYKRFAKMEAQSRKLEKSMKKGVVRAAIQHGKKDIQYTHYIHINKKQ